MYINISETIGDNTIVNVNKVINEVVISEKSPSDTQYRLIKILFDPLAQLVRAFGC